MNIHYKLTLNEYQEAAIVHYKSGKRPIFIAVFVGMATFFMLVGTDFSNIHQVINNILITFFALAFYLLFNRMVTAYQAKKVYNKSPMLSQEVSLRISGKGIRHDKKAEDNTIPWAHFLKWKKNDKYYLLYTNPHQFNVIPVRAMNEAQRKELDAHLEKYL